MKYQKLTLAFEEAGVTEEEVDRSLEYGGFEAIISAIRSAQPQAPAPVGLLELVAVVDVRGADRFVAEEEFTPEKGFWLSSKAKELLLSVVVDKATPAGKIRIDRLTRKSVDGSIKAELGDRAEISIGQFAATLKLGHEVVGDWVIAYLKELPGCAMCARWHVDEWGLCVCPVADPDEWCAGAHVLSGDSVSESL